MNDPHAHAQKTGCGCSAERAAEPAPVERATPGAAFVLLRQHEGRTGFPRGASSRGPHGCCSGSKAGDAAATAKDPVCGMTVDPAKTAHHAEHAGLAYHFCSAGCRTKFMADPDTYLGDKPLSEPEATPGAMWTCPMHSEIRREGPGTCPICGMALEPEEPRLDDGPNPELVDFTHRTWIAAALTLPLLAVSMLPEMLGVRLLSAAVSPWVQLALTAPIVLWAGWPFFQRGWTSVRTWHPSAANLQQFYNATSRSAASHGTEFANLSVSRRSSTILSASY